MTGSPGRNGKNRRRKPSPLNAVQRVWDASQQAANGAFVGQLPCLPLLHLYHFAQVEPGLMRKYRQTFALEKGAERC